jgi:hypothetical protein
LADIFETNGDFFPEACEIETYVMGYELLLQPSEEKISAVPQEFRPVFFVTDVQWIASKEM